MPNSLGLKEPGENWYLEYILSFFSDTVFGIIWKRLNVQGMINNEIFCFLAYFCLLITIIIRYAGQVWLHPDVKIWLVERRLIIVVFLKGWVKIVRWIPHQNQIMPLPRRYCHNESVHLIIVKLSLIKDIPGLEYGWLYAVIMCMQYRISNFNVQFYYFGKYFRY